MAKKKKKKQVSYRELVTALCAVEKGLTSWECDFVSDMSKWKYGYTDSQKRVIMKVYDRLLEKGLI